MSKSKNGHQSNNIIDVGDIVKKKSGKPFEHGGKVAVVKCFTTMIIPKVNPFKDKKIICAVRLIDCTKPVRLSILEKYNG